MNYIPDIPRTAMYVFKMLPEGTRCEVMDNILHMLPSTTTTHQTILGDIAFDVHQFVKQNHLGDLFIGPCDVYLDQENVVTPDIFLIRPENAKIINWRVYSASPI